tara:strand:+ start:450 stop:1112 length:663 start_codon:yes stop_codon:yes gene_type:complete
VEQLSNFYTPSGLQVYIKDPLINQEINLEDVIGKVEDTIPEHLRADIEMIIVGRFDEFEEQEISAFYKDGALHMSPSIIDAESFFDDAVHEIAHSVEDLYGYTIYGDQNLKKEFLRKRKYLHDMLWAKGFKVPLNFFMNSEYDEEFDMFLYKTVGYDKLSSICQGLFITAYAPTSLKEYFATGFLEFYLDSNHNFLKKTCPQLYKKLIVINDPEKLDNAD